MANKVRAVLDTNVFIAGLINPTGSPGHILKMVTLSSDPDDDKFLAAAIGGKADYLVTGDIGDLLHIHEYKGVMIVSPKEFLAAIS